MALMTHGVLTHPVAGNDFTAIVHQRGGVQLLGRLVEPNAVPYIYG